MITFEKSKELRDIFLNLKEEQIRLVAMLATERMWKSFADYLIIERSPNLEESARVCLDIIWEKTLKGKISDMREQEYDRMLDIVNHSSDEENPEGEFLTRYPLYFIGQLFSDMLSDDREQVINECSGSAIRPLEMICDDVLNSYSEDTLNQHPAIIAELNRIDHDVMLAKEFPQNISEVLNKKALYQTLQLVPVTSRHQSTC